MDLSSYLVGTIVKLDIVNGQYFKGTVLSSSENEIVIKDIKGNRVTLTATSISYIQELSE